MTILSSCDTIRKYKSVSPEIRPIRAGYDHQYLLYDKDGLKIVVQTSAFLGYFVLAWFDNSSANPISFLPYKTILYGNDTPLKLKSVSQGKDPNQKMTEVPQGKLVIVRPGEKLVVFLKYHPRGDTEYRHLTFKPILAGIKTPELKLELVDLL